MSLVATAKRGPLANKGKIRTNRYVARKRPAQEPRLAMRLASALPRALPHDLGHDLGSRLGSACGSLLRMCGRVLMMSVVLGVIVTMSLGLVMGYRFLTTSPFFDLRTIVINGQQRLTQEEILEQAGVSLGQNSLTVNMAELGERLGANPWIKTLNVRRTLPRELRIDVVERLPFFWVQRDGELFYAEEDGRAIAQVAADGFVSLPQLQLDPGSDEAHEVLQGFVEDLRARRWPIGLKNVAWVRVGLKDGLEIGLIEPRLVLRTTLAAWRNGLQDVVEVWNDLGRRGDLARTVSVSAQNGKVLVRLAAGPS